MPAVKERPARTPIATPADFKVLDKTHQKILEVLASMSRLLDHMDDNGPDAQAREMAGAIRAYFDGHVRQHHADEEAMVFPGLLASGDEELTHHVRRLQQDHGWLEEDWRMLGPQLEAIERGYNWYDLPMLRQALPIFENLNREHITLEETVVYPAARRQQQALAQGAKKRGARRGRPQRLDCRATQSPVEPPWTSPSTPTGCRSPRTGSSRRTRAC
jgi:hemerythrin-like domain-containing protein